MSAGEATRKRRHSTDKIRREWYKKWRQARDARRFLGTQPDVYKLSRLIID